MKTELRIRRPLHHASRGPPPPLSRERISVIILAARLRVRALLQALRTTSPKGRQWSAERRLRSWPRHANGCCHPPALRAWRAPQNDPLARTACFGRVAPPGAPPRLSLSTVDRPRRKPHSLHPRACLRKASFDERGFDSLTCN